ncbi:hypothetical protein LSH36_352g03036 [Paralvinella palmiformis]|uniref:Uncharacterized protein n=1 Tax=Paralvinella palmiformis TaxID=53620 RepID=A0AAD9JFN7_9ANNE|nr:hypothetical protein LSH36_352g03036 [Paralvinella palmiformis]
MSLNDWVNFFANDDNSRVLMDFKPILDLDLYGIAAYLDVSDVVLPNIVYDALASSSYVGLVGVTTGQTPVVFSISLDGRVAGTRPEQGAIITKARLYAFDDWKLDTNHNRNEAPWSCTNNRKVVSFELFSS